MAPSPEELERSTTWSIIRTAHLLEREVTALFAEHDLSPVQFGVLAHLAAHSSRTIAELARAVLVRPQSLTGVITSLETRTLVQRPSHRGRGRPSPVTLTAGGQQLLAQVWPVFTAADRATSLGLHPDEAGQLVTALQTLRASRP